jgi:hypothetical protein
MIDLSYHIEIQRGQIMSNARVRSIPPKFRARLDRGKCVSLEQLEPRILLYSTLGGQWTYSSRITYSFMPDGTSVGGVPSTLYQTLNATAPTASWKQQIEAAASLWENVTNVNLALVSDDGAAEGASGEQQDDPRFGDIRIGAVPLSSGVLAVTFVPPPVNGGTQAGDILLNSNVDWQINSNYDLMTVVAHEFGHALGLGESSVSTAVMYGTYNGIKQSLTSDDIAGVDSLYGTRQYDQFNTGNQHNNTYTTATNINSYISNAQIAIPGLDITTSSDTEWFYVNVPKTSTGTMSVSVQSSSLSSLSPKLQVYSSSLALVGQASAVGSMGATVTVSANVQPGQGYYFKVLTAGGPGPIGGYGLLVNFASGAQSAVAPPNTAVASEPNEAGGTSNDNAPTGGTGLFAGLIGTLTGWMDGYLMPPSLAGINASVSSAVSSAATTVLGALGSLTADIGPLIQSTDSDGVLTASSSGTNAASESESLLALLQAIDLSLEQGILGSDLLPDWVSVSA